MSASKAAAVRPDFRSLSINIPDSAWSAFSVAGEAKPTRTRLHASISINRVGFHCDAIEVGMISNTMDAVDPQWQEDLESYYQAAGADGPMDTLSIASRDYAVFLNPFC
jgi:hypothetical protein